MQGNKYKTVHLGDQEWMAENLRTTMYADMSIIPEVRDDTQWAELKTGALCNYNNDPDNGEKFGLLYNWFAVNSKKQLAPVGWHVATADDWEELNRWLDKNPLVTKSKAKALAAASDWKQSVLNLDGEPAKDISLNNTTGFSALPTGYRIDGRFEQQGYLSFWWTSTSSFPYMSIYYALMHNDYKLAFTDHAHEVGMPVRCVRNKQ